MWFRITLTLNGGKKYCGVRYLVAPNIHTGYFQAWELAEKIFSEKQIDRIELKELEDDDPEVLEYLKTKASK